MTGKDLTWHLTEKELTSSNPVIHIVDGLMRKGSPELVRKSESVASLSEVRRTAFREELPLSDVEERA